MDNFICANCMHGKKYRDDCEWEYMYDGTDYANDCCDWWRPTNADRIRSMTDEELAKFMNNVQATAYNSGLLEMKIQGFPAKKDAWLDWLKQEATQNE